MFSEFWWSLILQESCSLLAPSVTVFTEGQLSASKTNLVGVL